MNTFVLANKNDVLVAEVTDRDVLSIRVNRSAEILIDRECLENNMQASETIRIYLAGVRQDTEHTAKVKEIN